MKHNAFLRIIVFCLITTSCPIQTALAAAIVPVTGSGASFPYQIYSLWFMLSNRENTDFQINYIAKGSGGGIKDFQNHTVDFAASDAAMNDKEIEAVKEGVQLLPMTAGEVVLAYNLEGVTNLKLPRNVYPQIFLGIITKWNDPAIVEANPDIELPDLDITVISRSDSSGTTFVFTKHLSAISKEFEEGPGYGKKIHWPEAVHMKKCALNLGMSGAIQHTEGSIGYIDYGFALLANHKMARLQNRDGEFIAPGLEGGQAALANAKIPEDMIVWLSDPAGEKSYPITTYTWMMFYKKYDNPQKAKAIKTMINYCLDKGQNLSDRFGYIPLPENVVKTVRAAAANIQ
jgi:phosphate transport system substrate-binding protein